LCNADATHGGARAADRAYDAPARMLSGGALLPDGRARARHQRARFLRSDEVMTE
jgi:hypothetical protein